jgi:hypothetical protein
MPGAGTATYFVVAAATSPVGSTLGGTNNQFTPGGLPQPIVDNVGIANGQYFLLTNQANPTQNGIWYADANGPVPVMTGGAGGTALDPSVVVQVGPGGNANANTTWIYSPSVHGAPGFVLI